MNNLFKRAAIFTDLHLGCKNNERQFNLDCGKFIKWFIQVAKEREVDCIIFLGDWHHNRNSLQLSTLDYSVSNLENLNDIGIPVYFIPGNHDLAYKDRRDISSITIARNLINIHIFNEITSILNVTFCPWLVGDEWKEIPNHIKNSTYIFGHFELPHFMMNASIESPDHGGLNYNHFDDVKQWAFTGHFHKRQNKGKVLYIGNAFPHSFSDAWDDDRGMVILNWGEQPEFIKWPMAPNYKTLKLSELLEGPEDYLDDKTYVKITVDLNVTHADSQLIKDIFQVHYNPRKIDLINPNKQDETIFNTPILFQSIDQIVIEGLKNIDSISMDMNTLIDLYRGLE